MLKCHTNGAWSAEAVRCGVGHYNHAIELHPRSPFPRLPIPLATLACSPRLIPIVYTLLSLPLLSMTPR